MNTNKEIITMRRDSSLIGLNDFISHINCLIPTKKLTLVEIGSYQGESTEQFAKKFKTVYAVDPWKSGYDNNDVASLSNMTEVEKCFDSRMIKYPNVIKIKKTSSDYSKLVENNSIDVVYIDGNHQYEYVIEDIKNWITKIKKGGFLSGHDIWVNNVKKAIEDSNLKIDKKFGDSSWIVRLK